MTYSLFQAVYERPLDFSEERLFSVKKTRPPEIPCQGAIILNVKKRLISAENGDWWGKVVLVEGHWDGREGFVVCLLGLAWNNPILNNRPENRNCSQQEGCCQATHIDSDCIEAPRARFGGSNSSTLWLGPPGYGKWFSSWRIEYKRYLWKSILPNSCEWRPGFPWERHNYNTDDITNSYRTKRRIFDSNPSFV